MSVYTLVLDFVLDICDEFGNVLRYITTTENVGAGFVPEPPVEQNEAPIVEHQPAADVPIAIENPGGEIHLAEDNGGDDLVDNDQPIINQPPNRLPVVHPNLAASMFPLVKISPMDYIYFGVRSFIALAAFAIETYLCISSAGSGDCNCNDPKKDDDSKGKQKKHKEKMISVLCSCMTCVFTLVDVIIQCYRKKGKAQCLPVYNRCCLTWMICPLDRSTRKSIIDLMGVFVISCSLLSVMLTIGDFVVSLHEKETKLFQLNVLAAFMALVVWLSLMLSESRKFF